MFRTKSRRAHCVQHLEHRSTVASSVVAKATLPLRNRSGLHHANQGVPRLATSALREGELILAYVVARLARLATRGLLDGAPITRSQRLLITHLTDLQNTGTRYGDRNRQLRLDGGRLLHLARAGRATVALRIEHAEQTKVYSLAVNGKRTGAVQTSVVEGARSVPPQVSADGKARVLYEIEVR